MSEYLVYWGLFSLAMTISVGVLIILAAVGEGIFNPKAEDVSNLAVIVFFGLTLTAGPVTSFYVLNRFGMAPPCPTASVEARTQETTEYLGELQRRADELENLLSDPRQLTLSQVEKLLKKTLSFADDMKNRTEQQQKLINELEEIAKREAAGAEEAKALAAQIQSITREQLNAVKLLITEDAREESKRSFAYGVLFSFPLGILTSVLGALLYRRFGGVLKRDLAKVKAQKSAVGGG